MSSYCLNSSTLHPHNRNYLVNNIYGNTYVKYLFIVINICNKYVSLCGQSAEVSLLTFIFQPLNASVLLSDGVLESSWNMMAHGDAREGKWRGNWRMEWVASTLYTISELGVSSITTTDRHTSAASSRLNWRPCRFKWTRSFRRKTKSVFCACAITFQMQSTSNLNAHPCLLERNGMYTVVHKELHLPGHGPPFGQCRLKQVPWNWRQWFIACCP